ncbi:MAG: efflux RND transporter periplasmic adaptor subunit [Deltaproteobacteria bacterium]|nr:efflux RND transporter periplasmic adaptor subunit [Deltaproteobacteria bacterium]
MKSLPIALLASACLAACSQAGPASSHAPITGLIDATEIDVASKIPGRVKELSVHEGDRVTAGQTLLTIESEEMQAKLDQVQASITAAQARVRLAQAGARREEKEGARQALEAARHQLDITKKTYDRMSALLQSGAVPQAQFDEVESRYSVAKDQLAMAQARFDLVSRGARSEEIDALKALVQQGQGTLAEVQSYNKETTQTSPIQGEVTKIIVHRGELASTGYPILTIVDLDDVWASFAVREDLLAHVQKGMRIEADVPALGRRIPMEIFHVAAMGDFATWKATSDKNSFDLRSFEIRARPIQKVDGLRPGMTIRWSPE